MFKLIMLIIFTEKIKIKLTLSTYHGNALSKNMRHSPPALVGQNTLLLKEFALVESLIFVAKYSKILGQDTTNPVDLNLYFSWGI